MDKRLFIFLIILSMPRFVMAASTCYNGEENCWECGRDCTARFDPSTHTFHVSGTGKMADLATNGQAANIPWYSIRKSVQNITFEGNITSLSTYAFYQMPVENVTIPDSVTRIGFGAFDENTSLKNLKLSENLTYIDMYAFKGANLESIVIPDSVLKIDVGVFGSNANLKSVVMNDQTVLKTTFSGTNADLKIYCTGNLSKCQENAGDYADKVVAATTKKINGVTYVYDAKGKLCAKAGIRENKRIYTIDEANTVAGHVNRVSITYR